MPCKLTQDDFIYRAKAVHGDKYDYSKVEYKKSNDKVCIVCPEHGEFWQEANSHLKGSGCPKCAINYKALKRSKSLNDFISMAKSVHGDKYDYSKVSYANNKTKVCIICPEHGEFWQTPNQHLIGHECPQCAAKNRIVHHLKSTAEFIIEAKSIHGDKYDYSKVEYTGAHNKVCIICPIHGEFWQVAYYHIHGSGCPKCNSSKGEHAIYSWLTEHNIPFIYNKACLDFLKPQRPDFYLPDYNMIIEYDGRQHFYPVSAFGGNDGYKYIHKQDGRKNKLCEQNNVNILRIKYSDFVNIEQILKEKLNDSI